MKRKRRSISILSALPTIMLADTGSQNVNMERRFSDEKIAKGK